MRFLAGLLVVLAVAWGGWWWLGATAMERGAQAWFAQRAAEGWDARHGGLSVQGFPNRLDLTVDAPRIADPRRDLGWQADFVQLLALSYKPWHVILVLPPRQEVTVAGLSAGVASERMQASVVLRPVPDLPLDRAALAGDGLVLAAPDGRLLLRIDSLRAGSRAAPSRENGNDIAIEATALTLGPALAGALPPGALPDRIDRLRLEAELDLSAPLDRHMGRTRPFAQRVDLRDLRLDWGGLHVMGRGELRPDSAGFAEGRITLRVENWRIGLQTLVAAGLVRAELAPTWERALELMAAGSGNPEVLDLALLFQGGRASLGPLPLGPAPRLRPALARTD